MADWGSTATVKKASHGQPSATDVFNRSPPVYHIFLSKWRKRNRNGGKEIEKVKTQKNLILFYYIHTFILIGIGYTILLIGIFDWFRNIVVYY